MGFFLKLNKFKKLLLVACIFALGLGIYYYVSTGLTPQTNQNMPQEDKDYVIFESYVGGRPRRPGEVYSQNTELYNSGKLIMWGFTNRETTLDKKTMAKIKRLISAIMKKRAPYPEHQPHDVSFRYTLRSGDKTKYLQYGGHYRTELNKIEELITSE